MNKLNTPIIKDLVFEINDQCPNTCLFCSSKASPKWSNIIGLDLFRNTVDRIIKEFWIEKISISWWEPFLHENIIEIIEFCKKRALNTTIYTSWIWKRNTVDIDLLLSKEEKSLPKEYPEDKRKKLLNNIRQIFEQQKKWKYSEITKEMMLEVQKLWLDKIVFSLHCMDIDLSDELMWLKDSLVYMLQSLIYANSVWLNSELHFIPFKKNISDFKDILHEVAENENINTEIHILKFIPQWRGRINRELLQLSDENLQSFLDYINHLKINIPIKLWTALLSDNSYKCMAWIDKLVIRYDWIVLPCPAFKEIDTNLLNQKWLILWNIKNSEWISLLKSKERKIPLCELLYK